MADESPAPEGAAAEPAAPAEAATPPKQEEAARLPDDHPLVTAYERIKGELTDARTRVQEFEDANRTDDERREAQHQATQTERDEALRENALLKAALDHGLSAADLKIVGAHGTPEEIAERAKSLAERIGSGDRRPDPTLGGTEVTAASPDQWLREAAGK